MLSYDIRHLFLAAGLTLVANPASAQTLAEVGVGLYSDRGTAVETSQGTGPMASLRGAVPLGRLVNAFGAVGYVQIGEVGRSGTETDYYVWGWQLWSLRAGAELVVPIGPAEAGLSLGAGLAFRRRNVDGRVGDPPEQSGGVLEDDFSPDGLVVPDAFVRLPVGRWLVHARLADHVTFDLENLERHSPSVQLGLGYAW